MVDLLASKDKNINNKKITVLDSMNTISTPSSYVFNNKIRIDATSYGYLILKLS